MAQLLSATGASLFDVERYGTPAEQHNALSRLLDAMHAAGLSDADGIEAVKQELEEAKDKLADAEQERDDYKDGFDWMFDAWQESIANGYWPTGSDPKDDSLRLAIAADMQRGADAIRKLEELAAWSADGVLTPEDVARAWSEIK